MRRSRLFVLLACVVVGTGVFVACSRELHGDDILTKGKKLYSQNDEEIIIRHFFQDRKGGFFVDVGAYQWKDSSTTYYLEHHLGWSGIALDAQPWLAAGYEENRPHTKFFNYIVTDHSGTTETLFMAGPLSSTSADHLKLFPKASEIKPKEITVPTITLNELLDKNGVKKIDFMSMDIEEGEPAALAAFDIERFKPELICIESAPPVRERIETYFAAHNYERIPLYLKYDSVNWYYRPKKSAG